MVQCVDSLSLSEAVVDVLLDVEAVHVDEHWWFVLIEKLLLERVAVLSIVDNNFSIGGTHQPLIIRFQKGHIETVKCRV